MERQVQEHLLELLAAFTTGMLVCFVVDLYLHVRRHKLARCLGYRFCNEGWVKDCDPEPLTTAGMDCKLREVLSGVKN